MMFSLTGNKWLDKYIKACCAFRQELNSSACFSSPLTPKEIDSLQKCMDKIAKISNSVQKRLNKNKNDFR